MTNFFHHPRWWLAGIHPEKRRWNPAKQCREVRGLSEGVSVQRADLLLTLHDSTIHGIAFLAERPHL